MTDIIIPSPISPEETDNNTLKMEPKFAIVTSPFGLVMKLNLSPPSTESSNTKELPTIECDFNYSEYRMQFLEDEEPTPFVDIQTVMETTSIPPSTAQKPLRTTPTPPTVTIDHDQIPAFEVPVLLNQSLITPLVGPGKPIRKRKIVEDFKDDIVQITDAIAQDHILTPNSEPKLTRSAAKKLKLEPIPSPLPINTRRRKQPPRSSRSRSSSQSKSDDDSAGVAPKRPKRVKKSPVPALPPVEEMTENSNFEFPKTVPVLDFYGNINQIVSNPSPVQAPAPTLDFYRDTNKNDPNPSPVLSNSLELQKTPMYSTLCNTEFQGPAFTSFNQPHCMYPYVTPMAYFGVPFIPMPQFFTFGHPFSPHLPYPGPIHPFYGPYHNYNVNMAMAYPGFSFPPTTSVKDPTGTAFPTAQMTPSIVNNNSMKTLVLSPDVSAVENEHITNIKQNPEDNLAVVNTDESQTTITSETASDQNEINMDFYDPLDFELLEDVTEEDLMLIIDGEMDYAAKIYNCNPISNFILVEQPSKHNRDGSSLNTPPRQQDLKQIPTVKNKEEIQIPLMPVLEPDELQFLSNLGPPESIFYECPRCLDRFTNFTSARYHTAINCRNMKIKLASSA